MTGCSLIALSCWRSLQRLLPLSLQSLQVTLTSCMSLQHTRAAQTSNSGCACCSADPAHPPAQPLQTPPAAACQAAPSRGLAAARRPCSRT